MNGVIYWIRRFQRGLSRVPTVGSRFGLGGNGEMRLKNTCDDVLPRRENGDDDTGDFTRRSNPRWKTV